MGKYINKEERSIEERLRENESRLEEIETQLDYLVIKYAEMSHRLGFKLKDELKEREQDKEGKA